jgi:Domain of unknown function DUF11
LVGEPRLRLTKQAQPPAFVPGEPASFVLIVNNDGLGPTTETATILDNVPAGLRLGTMPAGCTAIGQAVTCIIPAGLAPGASVTFILPVTPQPEITGSTVRNVATLTGGGGDGCAAERCTGEAEVPVGSVTAIPISSPATLAVLATLLMLLAAARLRGQVRPGS